MTSFPEWLTPMAATLTAERFQEPGWIFERKLDGIRLLAFRDGDSVRLLSRNRLPQSYPSVAKAIAALPVRDVILDGEAAARDAGDARPSRDPRAALHERERPAQASGALGEAGAGRPGLVHGVDLAEYYEAIAPVMVPHVRNRPLTLERFHRGIGEPGFFQKDVSKGFPAWLERVEVPKKDGVTTSPSRWIARRTSTMSSASRTRWARAWSKNIRRS